MTDWAALDQKYMMPTYSHLKLPIMIEKGQGSYLFDTEGNKYLDLFTGLAVNVVGHSHPRIVETLVDQGSRFLHISNIYLNKPAISLARRLSELSTGGKVFFGNSGAEATEAAIKFIHKYQAKKAPDRNGIVVLKSGFHGRTLGALKLTRQPHVYQDFPLPPYKVIEIEAEDSKALEAAMKEKPLALLMEPVMGSAGVLPLSDEFMRKAHDLCKENQVLFCMDEIQTGMGRTGSLFSYQSIDGISPDLVLFAKGAGGGLPLGGIIASPALSDLFKPGDHGTTFAPSPLSAALGNTVLDILEDGLLDESRIVSSYLWEQLAQMKVDNEHIDELRGKGFMVGIMLKGDPSLASQLRKNMLNRGILIDLTQKTIIRLLPPLTLTKEEVDTFIAVFSEELNKLSRHSE